MLFPKRPWAASRSPLSLLHRRPRLQVRCKSRAKTRRNPLLYTSSRMESVTWKNQHTCMTWTSMQVWLFWGKIDTRGVHEAKKEIFTNETIDGKRKADLINLIWRYQICVWFFIYNENVFMFWCQFYIYYMVYSFSSYRSSYLHALFFAGKTAYRIWKWMSLIFLLKYCDFNYHVYRDLNLWLPRNGLVVPE